MVRESAWLGIDAFNIRPTLLFLLSVPNQNRGEDHAQKPQELTQRHHKEQREGILG